MEISIEEEEIQRHKENQSRNPISRNIARFDVDSRTLGEGRLGDRERHRDQGTNNHKESRGGGLPRRGSSFPGRDELPSDGDDGDDQDDGDGDDGDDESDKAPTRYGGHNPPSSYFHPSNGRMTAGGSISQNISRPRGMGNATGRIKDWIKQIIREKLSMDPSTLTALKGIKFDQPPVYNGANDVEQFVQWLQPFMRWMVLNQLVGHDMEATRVTVLGQYLKGTALEWFNTIVDDSTRSQRWTFEKTILALFAQFVHQSMMLQATQKFESVRYVKGNGVAGLANKLLKWADRMVVYPDEYMVRRAFYNALPTRISLILGPMRGMSPKKNSMDELVDAALEVEDALVGETMRHIPREVSTSNTARNLPRPEAGSSSRPERKFKRVFGRRPGKGREGGERDRFNDRKEVTAHNRNMESRNVNDSNRPNCPSRDPRMKDSNDVTCWNCGQKGHYANSPKCPQKASGPAIRHMDENDQEITEGDDDQVRTNENKVNKDEEVKPELRSMTIHTAMSDSEYNYSDLEGTQYDSEGSYENALGSINDEEEQYYSISEDEFGFRIPEMKSMRIVDDMEDIDETRAHYVNLRRRIHRNRGEVIEIPDSDTEDEGERPVMNRDRGCSIDRTDCTSVRVH
ncbi:hypothetical protein QCA50_008503 [Cerrena zonata]|uniref:CCHC-type domain-containing protein n=1 Tax=Cerrena zonata TaxID=2478898 RepID=A0AAW0G350_9APHY